MRPPYMIKACSLDLINSSSVLADVYWTEDIDLIRDRGHIICNFKNEVEWNAISNRKSFLVRIKSPRTP